MSRPRRLAGRFVLLLVAVVVVAGCTSGPTDATRQIPTTSAQPVPVPHRGLSVAVVTHPASEVADPTVAALLTDLTELQADNEPEVRRVRPLVPDEPVFVADLAALAARDGASLTCVLGRTGLQTAEELWALHPDTRFCAPVTRRPTTAPEGEGIDVLVLQAGQLGHVLGVVAAAAGGPGGVAVALGHHELQGARFDAGLTAGLRGIPVHTPDPELDPAAGLAALEESGAGVLVVGSGPSAPALVAAATELGMPIVGPRELVDDGAGEGFLLTWDLQWKDILQPAVDRLLHDEPGGVHELGLTQDVFGLEVGPAAPSGGGDLLAYVTGRLEAGADSAEPLELPALPGLRLPGDEASADTPSTAEAPDAADTGDLDRP